MYGGSAVLMRPVAPGTARKTSTRILRSAGTTVASAGPVGSVRRASPGRRRSTSTANSVASGAAGSALSRAPSTASSPSAQRDRSAKHHPLLLAARGDTLPAAASAAAGGYPSEGREDSPSPANGTPSSSSSAAEAALYPHLDLDFTPRLSAAQHAGCLLAAAAAAGLYALLVLRVHVERNMSIGQRVIATVLFAAGYGVARWVRPDKILPCQPRYRHAF